MKKSLFTKIVLLLMTTSLYSQYDYGLDVCKKDARIEGRLNLNNGDKSVFIGENAGINDDKSDNENVFIGYDSGSMNFTGRSNVFVGTASGLFNSSGNNNTFLGSGSGFSNMTGSQNTFVGQFSGGNTTTGGGNTFIGDNAGTVNKIGSLNTYIGRQSGQNSTGSFNVFIGRQSGFNETGSEKLYIENTTSSSPLIYGEFDNDKVQINGSLTVTEFARLVPISAPLSPERGTMYYDSSDDKVKVWTGNTWGNLFFSSSTQIERAFDNESPCNTSCVEENQNLKVRVEQLEERLEKYEVMETKLERMEKLVMQFSVNPITKQNIEINKSARLEQNIPNPFQGFTKIQYYLPKESRNSRINIYDISGQVVKVIKLEGSGIGDVEVQVDEFSKGIYHYSLEIDGQVIDTKKMSSIK